MDVDVDACGHRSYSDSDSDSDSIQYHPHQDDELDDDSDDGGDTRTAPHTDRHGNRLVDATPTLLPPPPTTPALDRAPPSQHTNPQHTHHNHISDRPQSW